MPKTTPDEIYRYLHNELPADYPAFLRQESAVKELTPHPGSAPVKSRTDFVSVNRTNVFDELAQISKIPGVVHNFSIEYYPYSPEQDVSEVDWIWDGINEQRVVNVVHHPERKEYAVIRFAVNDPNHRENMRHWNDRVKGHQDSIDSRRRKIESNRQIANENRKITDDARNKNIELWRFVAKELKQGHVPDLKQYKREMLLRQLVELDGTKDSHQTKSTGIDSTIYPAGYDTHSRRD